MTGSEFKFLRRVRIHDGECGAVARALHHAAQKVALVRNEQSLISDECIPLRQAGSEKASDSTSNERKQMSTKTSIKRIALVAVSALGFGMLSITSANAAALVADAIAIPSANGATTVGTASSVVVSQSATAATTAAAADTMKMSVTLTSKPIGSAVTAADADGGRAGTAPLMTNAGNAASFDDAASAQTSGVYTATTINNASTPVLAAASNHAVGTLSITPDLPGVYVITLVGLDASDAAVGATSTTYTVIAAAANASAPTGTASLTAAWSCTVVQAGEGCLGSNGSYANPVLTATMPAGIVAAAASDLKVKVTRTADSDLPANSVIGLTASGVMTYSSSTSALTLTPNVSGSGLLDTAGLYEFLVFEDTDLNSDYTAGERFVTTSLRLAGAPTGYSISRTPSAGAVGDQTIIDITFLDADLNPTATDAPTITLTAASLVGTKTFDKTNALASTGKYRQILTIGSNAAGAATGSNPLAFSGTVGGVTVAVASTITVNVGVNGTSFAPVAATGVQATTAAAVELTDGNESGALRVNLANTTVYYTVAAAAGSKVEVRTTPNAGTLTTQVSTTGTRFYTALADGSVTFPVVVTNPVAAATGVAATGYTITVESSDGDLSYTVTYVDPGAAWTILPAPSVNLVAKGSLKYTAILKDVFGTALANKAVTATVSGRNTATFSGTTNAAGVFEFTVTDTDTRACCSTTTDVITDTVTLTYNYTNVAGTAAAATGGTGTITYLATAAAASDVTITSAGGAAANAATVDQLERVAGVPDATARVTYTATVRTSTGAAIAAGTICTWTADADTIFYLGSSTSATSSGQCAVTVYRQKTGYAAVTVSVGGKTASNGVVLWSNVAGNGTSTSGSARNIVIAASPASVVSAGTSTITATVTDRWGNPVAGVPVTFAELGAGRIAATGAVATNIAGVASTDFTSNAGETGTNTVSATIPGTTQTADLAGLVAGVAVAGVNAGNRTTSTTVTITKDTSVSTADALLELAKAIGTGNSANAAADAALEAIDAANAATDAANLAAEAADAATVAAEEARDAADAATAAVEALASEVATLVAALKAQITTLANTVAKIAKRVKA